LRLTFFRSPAALVLLVSLSLFVAACAGNTTAGSSVAPEASGDANTSTGTRVGADAAEATDTHDDASMGEQESIAEDGASDESHTDVEADAKVDAEEVYVSPLNDAIGLEFGLPDGRSYEDLVQERQYEVQTCMNDRGFDYTPVIIGEIDPFARVAVDPDIQTGTAAYVAKYGYALSTSIYEELDIYFAPAPQSDNGTDSNEEYFESLDQSGQDAYSISLYGTEPIVNETTGEFEEAPDAISGCINVGWEFIEGTPEENAIRSAFEEEFGNVHGDIAERLAAEPALTALDAEWVRCMNEQQYTFARPHEAQASVASQLLPIQTRLFESGRLDDETFLTMTEDEQQAYLDEYVPTAPDLTPELRADIDRLITYEIAVASADFSCSIGHEEIRRATRIAFEQQFVDENQGAIVALLEGVSGT